jgi:hypothetical protein
MLLTWVRAALKFRTSKSAVAVNQSFWAKFFEVQFPEKDNFKRSFQF